jgi:peptidyl-Asp metalloendopeptidase
MKRTFASALALVSLTANAATNLFHPDPGVLTSHDRAVVAAMRDTPGVTDVTVVSIDRSLLEGSKTFAVDIGAHPPQAKGAFSATDHSKRRIWWGHLIPGTCDGQGGRPAALHDDSVMLVIGPQTVTGRIHTCEGSFLHLTTLGHDRYLLTRIDEAALPLDTPDEVTDAASQPKHTDAPIPLTASIHAPGDTPDTSVVDVLYVFSPEAVKGYNGDIEGAAAMYNGLMNLIHQWSGSEGTHVTFKVAGVLDVSHVTGGNLPLEQWADPGTAVGRYIADRRDALHADIVSVLDGGRPGYCGMGYRPADKSTAYNVTIWYCPENILTHEVGHNLGLTHDPGQGTPPYASGFKLAGAFRTVMAYDCSPACPRLNYLSSPDKSILGIPMGTKDLSDAVRRVQERRFTVSNFYPKWAQQYVLNQGTLPPDQYFRVSLCKRDGTGCPYEIHAIVGDGDEFTWPYHLAVDINSQLPRDIIRAGELRGSEAEGDIHPIKGSRHRNILWMHSVQQATYVLNIERKGYTFVDRGAMHESHAGSLPRGEAVTATVREAATDRVLESVTYANPTNGELNIYQWPARLATAINESHGKYLRGGERTADGTIEAVAGSGYRNRLWAPDIAGVTYTVELTFHDARRH